VNATPILRVCPCGDRHPAGQRCPNRTAPSRTRERPGSIRRWRQLRAAIIRRDGGICQVCGSDRRLEVHHLNGDWRNHDPENLRTVCFDPNPRGGHRE
jgi:5-methylcytosine-specific restriction endonuclease McrA